jgi:hypothetical protein
MAIGTSKAKNFEFNTLTDFPGYNSSYDKTKIVPNYLVEGSLNVYKERDGNIWNRPGLKRRGAADTTISPVSSEFVWNTSWGESYILWVSNSKLQVEIDDVWYDLLTGVTDTRYVFDNWFNNTQKKDVCIMVNGNDYIQMWSGGAATVLSATADTITKTGTSFWSQVGFDSGALATIGGSTSQFDVTNTVGTTYRYTWDTTGTDPLISATTVPVGSYVLIGAQNFTTANNGLFVVTGSGTNYFEVTNASGAVESNKTIGTGYIYTRFNKVIRISGTDYAYTGGWDTTTLTGVTPNASGIAADAIAIQAVITTPTTPAANYSNDYIKVVSNRAVIGSYTSQVVYGSDVEDYTDFVVPALREVGSAFQVTLDGTGKGITERKGTIYLGYGTNGWMSVSFTTTAVDVDIVEETVTVKYPVARLQAPKAHEFIDTVGDSIIYLAQDNQVRMVGDFTNLYQQGYPSISQPICTELETVNFINGALKCIGEFVFITAPNIGTTYLYQVRTSVDASGQVVAERLWHPPWIWNATRVDEIGGEILVFSNANPQVYYGFNTMQWYDDSPFDEELPYTCVAAFAYRSNNRRQGLQDFDKVYTEGYISGGTLLNLTVNYNYIGSTGQSILTVNSITRPVTTFSQQISSLGDESLGDSSLGDQIAEDSIPKFKCINSLALTNCFEYQTVYTSDAANSRWGILGIGTNAELTDTEQANYLINKLRV